MYIILKAFDALVSIFGYLFSVTAAMAKTSTSENTHWFEKVSSFRAP